MPITAPATSEIAQPVRDWAWAHTLAGPLAFGLMLALPVESLTYPIRCSFGLLLWTAWWWVFRPVHLAVTGLLPLAVVAVFNFVPVAEILPSYADELVILLVAANILSTAWQKWGLDRRIALYVIGWRGNGREPADHGLVFDLCRFERFPASQRRCGDDDSHRHRDVALHRHRRSVEQ